MDIFEKICNHWGDKVPIMAAEECGELLVAISHRERDRISDDAVATEIADVIISCGMLCHRYHITLEEVAKKIIKKLEKEYK